MARDNEYDPDSTENAPKMTGIFQQLFKHYGDWSTSGDGLKKKFCVSNLSAPKFLQNLFASLKDHSSENMSQSAFSNANRHVIFGYA